MLSPLLLLSWRLAAFALELLLLGTHLKVLLCVGKPYSASELSSKRWSYFLIDAASPWNSLAAVLAGNSVGQQHNWLLAPNSGTTTPSGLLALLLLVALGHGALHLFYIATWHRRHAGNVIKMSAVQDMRSRWQRFDAGEVVWFLLGTSYDILTHAAIAALLAHTLLTA